LADDEDNRGQSGVAVTLCHMPVSRLPKHACETNELQLAAVVSK